MPGTNDKLPTREQIERRAREIYVQRGCLAGFEQEDWLTAEKELTESLNAGEEHADTLSSARPQKYPLMTMFLEFFGLREQPFGMTPDPAYLYASRTHSEALESLSFGIEDNRGFFALIAEPGMGKTTLLYQLLEQLRDTARSVLVFQTQCTSREFFEYILHDLGVDTKGLGLVEMHGKLNEVLFGELLAGKRFVLVVDEAQNLDDSVLETVRMLSNFETHNTKLLQIILAGQPPLAAKLAQPSLSQLRQRIAVLSRLVPFNLEETGLYIQHRLNVAGHSGQPIFDPLSVVRIARHSQGIPRNINNLCYTSLLLAYKAERPTVTADIVQQAVARLDMESLAPASAPGVSLVAEPAPLPAPVTPVAVPVAAPVTATLAPAAVSAPGTAPAPATAPVIAVMAAAAASATGTKLPPPRAATAVASNSNPKDRPAKGYLSYDTGRKISFPKWPVRSAILAVIVLSGGSLLAILGRSEPRQPHSRAIFDHSSAAIALPKLTAEPSGTPENYDAAPQETENGQVLTVVAGPQQTLENLARRYLGYFDSELSQQIRSLNPDLKDPNHLEAGQLIRIPLPPGAMKKINDTAEGPAPEPSQSLLTRFTALLRDRK